MSIAYSECQAYRQAGKGKDKKKRKKQGKNKKINKKKKKAYEGTANFPKLCSSLNFSECFPFNFLEMVAL